MKLGKQLLTSQLILYAYHFFEAIYFLKSCPIFSLLKEVERKFDEKIVGLVFDL
jgi:hypothetical protein